LVLGQNLRSRGRPFGKVGAKACATNLFKCATNKCATNIFTGEKAMTREEVITVIKKAAEELGRVPSLNELMGSRKVSSHAIRRYFGHYVAALEACGLERSGHGYKVSAKALFADWIGLVRELKKVPSLNEYEARGKYSTGPLVRRFGGWLHVAPGLMRYAREQRLEAEWKDELETVAAYLGTAPMHIRNAASISSSSCRPRIRMDEPI
jgi:hypothetical protein